MKNHAEGILLVVIVCLIWTFSSLIVKTAEGDGLDPFVLTYLCNILFVLYLVPRSDKPRTQERRAALWLSPLWMGANATYNASLSSTSITSSTILSTTSSLWALAAAVAIGVERSSCAKLVAGGLVVAGAALVAWGDDDNGDHQGSVIGDALALLSAALYGVYGARLALDHDNLPSLSTSALFGWLGVWNAVLFFVPVALWVAFGRAAAPWSPRLLALVFVKGLFDNALSDYLWARAVVLTSPTIASICLSLTIPMAFALDALPDALRHELAVHAPANVALQAMGAVVVVAAVVLVAWPAKPDAAANPPDDGAQDDLLPADDHQAIDDLDRSPPSPAPLLCTPPRSSKSPNTPDAHGGIPLSTSDGPSLSAR